MLAQIRQFWTNLSLNQRIIYGSVAAVLIAVVAGVGFWSSQTDYAVLFAKLPADDAAAIVKKLDADRVSYKLNSDGTTILVPASNVQKTRMNVVVAGLPSGGGKGYELFDTMTLGATPFMQNINLIRATQGELERTIMELEPVAQAKVLIVQPDPTPFVREEKPSTASVVVKTKPGQTLSRASVAGIVALTAGAVKGLSSDNVTVIDSEGRVLSEKKEGSRGNLASNDQLSYQREVEAHLVENAQEILTRLLGPGRAIVRVTAEMSFRHLTQSSETFDPEGAVILREQTMKSKMSPVTPVGPVGAISNIPPGVVPPPPAPPGPAKNDETTESEYAVSNVHKSQEEQQGVIDRLTVAVMLIPPKGAGDTPEEIMGVGTEEIRDLVKTAVGFKNDRDEIQVSVGKSPHEQEAVAQNDNAVATPPPFLFGRDYATVVRGASLGLAGLIGLAMVAKLLRRKPKTASGSAVPAFASLNADIPELADLHAVAATIKAWLEEPAVIRFEGKPGANMPQAKPA